MEVFSLFLLERSLFIPRHSVVWRYLSIVLASRPLEEVFRAGEARDRSGESEHTLGGPRTIGNKLLEREGELGADWRPSLPSGLRIPVNEDERAILPNCGDVWHCCSSFAVLSAILFDLDGAFDSNCCVPLA